MFEAYLKTHVYIDSDVAVQLLTKQIARAYENKQGDRVSELTAVKCLFEEFDLRVYRSQIYGEEGVADYPATLTVALRAVKAYLDKLSFVRMTYLTSDDILSILPQCVYTPSARDVARKFLNAHHVIWTVVK
jgi:hypothetical protein